MITLRGIRQIYREHRGENQAAVVLKLIKEYKIGKIIAYFMLDNDGSDDTRVNAILRKLYPSMIKDQRTRCLFCCLGHAVSLTAHVLILGRESDKLPKDSEFYQFTGDE